MTTISKSHQWYMYHRWTNISSWDHNVSTIWSGTVQTWRLMLPCTIGWCNQGLCLPGWPTVLFSHCLLVSLSSHCPVCLSFCRNLSAEWEVCVLWIHWSSFYRIFIWLNNSLLLDLANLTWGVVLCRCATTASGKKTSVALRPASSPKLARVRKS